MRTKGALAAIVLTVAAFTADAQTPELTQELLYQDQWSLSYPSGWITNTNALPLIATDEGAAATMQRDAPLPSGGIVIGIVPPTAMASFGLTYTASAEEMMPALAGFFGGETAIAPFTGLEEPALATPLIGTTRVPALSQLVVFEKEGTVFAFLVVAEDFAAQTPLVQAIIASLDVLQPIP